jgi:hypothetical protein
MQVALDGGLAVAAVGGDCAGDLAGAPGNPFDGGHQLRAVRGGAAFHGVVQDDAVVVADLGFVPELGPLEVDAQPSATRIHLPGGAARKVSASVRRAHIPDISAASGPRTGDLEGP